MSWSLAQAVVGVETPTNNVTTISATFGSSVTAGNLVVAVVSMHGGNSFSVKDSVNNVAFTNVAAYIPGFGIGIAFYQPPVGGGSFQVTATFTNPVGPGIAIFEVAVPTAGFIVAADGSVVDANATAITATTAVVTPSISDFVIAAASFGGSVSPTVSSIGSGWTSGYQGNSSSNANGLTAIYALNQSASITPSITYNGSTQWAMAAVAFKATAPVPLIATNPHVTKNGFFCFLATNPSGTNVSNLTSVPGTPSVFVGGSAASLGSLIWNDTTHDSPAAFWPILSPTVTPSSVITYTAAANCIGTALGGSLVVSSPASAVNSFGSLEPIYGETSSSWGPPTTTKAACNLDNGAWNSSGAQPHAANRALQLAFNSQSGSTITVDSSDASQVFSWTSPSTKMIFANLADYLNTNGIDAFGYPVQQGSYAVSWVDANIGTGNEAKFFIAANPNTCAVSIRAGDGNPETGGTNSSSPGSTTATTWSGGVRSVLPGNRVVITYANVNYASNPNATFGYNLFLQLFCNAPLGLWSSGSNISGLIVVGPGDTVAAVLANPWAIAQPLKSALMASNGNGPATIRAMNTCVGGIYGNLIGTTDRSLRVLGQASFGRNKYGPPVIGVTLTGLRRYSTDPTNPIVAWSSTKLYIQKLGVDGVDVVNNPSLGPYLDFTLRDATQHGTLDNGQYLNPFPGQGKTCCLEFVTSAAHGLRTGDLVQFPSGTAATGYILFPITGGASATALPACSVTNGSANITFATSITVAATTTEQIVFGSDSTSSVYNLVNSTGSPITSTTWTMASNYPGTTNGASTCHLAAGSSLALPACNVVNGSPSITFATAITLQAATGGVPFQQGLTFGSDSTGNAYNIANATGSPVTSATWTMGVNYRGITNTASTCNMAAIVNINNIVPDVFVTGPTTFVVEAGDTFFGATIPSSGPIQQLASTSTITLPSLLAGTVQTGGSAPFGFYPALAAQVGCNEVQMPFQIYMSPALINQICDEWASVSPPGMQFAIELCDEVWNNTFPAFAPVQRFGNLLKYVPNSWSNNVYSPGTAGAINLYSAYVTILADMWETAQARLDTYARGYKIVRLIGGQFDDDLYLQEAVTFCNNNGIAFDRGMIAPYVTCPPGTNTTWVAACQSGGGNLTAPQIIDVTRYYLKYSSRWWTAYSNNSQFLQAYTVTGTKPILTCYESALQNPIPISNEALVWDIWYHPEFALAFNAYAQQMQDGNPNVSGSGIAIANHYTHGSMRGNSTNTQDIWSLQVMAAQPAGAGSSNVFATTQATGATGNGINNDVSNQSVALNAWLNWMAVANFPSGGATSSFNVTPTTLPQHATSPVVLMLSGLGTSWTSGSAISIQNSVTGTTTAVAGTFTAISTESATLAITTGAGTGTFTITIDGVVSPLITVAIATIRVSPSSIAPNQSSAVNLILIGTGTAWTSGSTVTLQNSVSGTTTVHKGTWTDTSTGLAMLTITTGSGVGTWTITVDGTVSQLLGVKNNKVKITPRMMNRTLRLRL